MKNPPKTEKTVIFYFIDRRNNLLSYYFIGHIDEEGNFWHSMSGKLKNSDEFEALLWCELPPMPWKKS